MAKQIIKLTESDLHRIIRNTAKKVIKEAWQDDLSALYDGPGGAAGMDLDKKDEILRNAKRQYSNPADYKKDINKFYADRERGERINKALKDPSFELWGDEFDDEFAAQGYPSAKDFEGMPYSKSKYDKRIKNGEQPAALKRVMRQDGGENEGPGADSSTMSQDDFNARLQALKDMGVLENRVRKAVRESINKVLKEGRGRK